MSFAAVALIVGSSAFTAKNKRAVIRYYKVDAINYPNASDPNGYQYFSGDRCENGGSLCSMEWDLGSNPSPTADGTPLPTTGVTQQSDTLEPGHFE
ncbi:hypothetical protein [Pedobacter sp. BMA]|uniref:hypothetical protein n=1 Tax=Pedobacter sp. BMA TaxID=1663685 RepID=UPI00064ABD97|nr:hypothetical protein [Pedobacter sp. BMA]KLT67113.1 hypothetical protein AB669_04290 [Pedobacter sp. BMA]